MKRYVALILALVLGVSGMTAAARTGYNCSDWAVEELGTAEDSGLIPDEFADIDFSEKLTRADFSRVLVNTYESLTVTEIVPTEENPFDDTDDTAALKAYTMGFIMGTGEGKFSPDSFLSREQAATMLFRLYDSVRGAADTEKNSGTFSDDADISDWAKESVYFMEAIKVVNGVGENRFAPKSNISAEQSVIAALRLSEYIISNTEENPDPYSDAETTDVPEQTEEDAFTVAFIGGSLTQGGATWIAATRACLQEKMPDKKITTINAGKGGTTSAYGAARFSEDVAKYEPDMVFIEFAVNDTTMSTETEQKVYMESMIRQCKKLDKEPIVIFVYAPYPVEKDSDTYQKWLKGVNVKEGLAEHYGIKSINIDEYMRRDYENIKDEKGYASYTDYIKTMYAVSGSGFDVHGGYTKYGEAIVEALNEDYDGCMSLMKDESIYCTSEKSLVEAAYDQITVTSGRMNYSGSWSFYTADNKFKTEDSKITISEGHYSYPFFTNGIAQIENSEAAFGFDTKAEAISLNFCTATAGNSAKVYVDGKETATVTCYNATNHAANYNTAWISLPNDGKTHRVIFVVDKPTSDKYVFRFGSVIERYKK